MSAFHLRPVSEASPSPTPSASTTRSSDQSAPFNRDSTLSTGLLPSTPSSASAMSRSRRPLSPSSLRDVDLSHDADTPPRKYPAPPTGHDLMAMFPPAPPDMRPGPTSGYFQRQERAFFAQAGKEIVRVRVEVDVPHDVDLESGKARGREIGTHRIWPQGHAQQGSHPHHQSPAQSPAAPVHYPHPSSRLSQRVPVPVTPTSAFPTAHAPSAQPPLNPHSTTPHQPVLDPVAPDMKVEIQSEEYRDDDEAWRRPMPYAERRRAGKHTRRVIVKN